jgi:hypothetical protein
MITFKGIEIDRASRTISHRGVTRYFTRTTSFARFRMLVFFLLAGGASKEMAFWHVYGGDPDGGPETGEKCVQVMMSQATEWHLRKLGLEFRSWRIAGVSFYEIVPTYELPVPKRFSYSGKNIAMQMGGTPINSRAPL